MVDWTLNGVSDPGLVGLTINDWDQRPVKAQIMGSLKCFKPEPGVLKDPFGGLTYDGLELKPFAWAIVRDETVFLYRYGLVCILQKTNGSYEVIGQETKQLVKMSRMYGGPRKVIQLTEEDMQAIDPLAE